MAREAPFEPGCSEGVKTRVNCENYQKTKQKIMNQQNARTLDFTVDYVPFLPNTLKIRLPLTSLDEGVH